MARVVGSFMYALFFIISFGASIIGAICGIGGGVIIKPVLDASGALFTRYHQLPLGLHGLGHDLLFGAA